MLKKDELFVSLLFFIEISHGIVSQSMEKNNFVRNYCEKIQNQNTT